MLIQRQAARAFMARQLDDFGWMKAASEDRLLAEMRRMRVRPKFKTKPWLHQLVCFYIGMHNPEFLFLLDMGLGKSKIMMDLFTQAQRERRARRMLVTVPRLINIDSWRDDLAVHSNLEPCGVDCSDADEKFHRLANPTGDVTVIDYQGLHWALSERKGGKGKKARTLVVNEDRVAAVQRVYDFVVIDESHKLANTESLWFKLMRRITQTAAFTYATTGTLFGSDVEAIWPQFYLVDKGATFGENKGLFRHSFFDAEPNRFGRGEKYTYRPSMDAKLHRMLQHRSIRYDEGEVLDLPPRVAVVEQYDMGAEQREHYMRALEGFINAAGDVQELTGQWHKMRQIASGYLSWADDSGAHVVRFKHNPKLDGLEALLDAMGGRAKAVIPHDYVETGRMICERLAAMGIGYEWFYGGTKDHSASRRRFMDDPACRVFVMNSESGGTGNDGLQRVARYMFMYESPTGPTLRQQVVKRIHRPGQEVRSFIYDLVMRRSLEPGILAGIRDSRDTYESVANGRARPGKGFFLSDWVPGVAPPGV